MSTRNIALRLVPIPGFISMARALRVGHESDEDDLQRENAGPEGSKDSLTVLYDARCRSSEAAVHNTMAVARCMESMVHAASRGDMRALTHWHSTCKGIVATVAKGGQ